MDRDIAILRRAEELDAELARLNHMLDSPHIQVISPKDPLSTIRDADHYTRCRIYASHLHAEIQNDFPELNAHYKEHYSDPTISTEIPVLGKIKPKFKHEEAVRVHWGHIDKFCVTVYDRRLIPNVKPIIEKLNSEGGVNFETTYSPRFP